MKQNESLLFKRDVQINDDIHVLIPTIGEILEFGEDEYYGLVSSLTAMPIDMMAELDDVGIDFTEINEYELFLILFNGLKSSDMRLVFGDLDLTAFEPAVNKKNGEVVLYDSAHDIVIDRSIQNMIASALRRIHHLEKNIKKPGNDEAKSYLIELAKKKRKRRKRGNGGSNLEQLIVAMVNTEEFKYKFDEVKTLSIYQFNESVKQIIKKVDYNNRMIGVYAGTVSAKEMSQDDLNWLIHK